MRKEGTLTILKASAVEPRGVDWLWKEHIPYGMIVTVAGRPDTGKTMFCMHVASDLSHDAPVVYSTVEDPLHEVVRPRLEAAGANLDNVHLWKDGVTIPKDIPMIRDYIEENGIVLFVLDSIAAQLGVNMSNDQATKRALAPLRSLAEDTDCAFICLHHTRKSITKNMTALEAIGGSGGGLNAVSRVAYIFGHSSEDQDERILAQAKCNIAKKRTPLTFEMDAEYYYINKAEYSSGFLVHTGEAEGVTAERVLATMPDSAHAVESPARLANAAEWIVTYLSRGPRDMKATTRAARGAGFTGVRLRRAVEKMKIEQHGTKWKLPDGLMELISD
jgi:putative DNA primase/helicase